MLKRILLYLWQLPQHLLALLILCICQRKIAAAGNADTYKTSRIYRLEGTDWGISLGRYIIISTRHGDMTIRHEYGHSRQSLYLGPAYLIVVGLPSLAMNLVSRALLNRGRGKMQANYYRRWPESWADRLGHVERP
ncbi:MAG: hypothetical protein LLF89_00810 [Spirochaetaceae bacterium]|nr:hypothetical protein [Spirochaetaceae bacterium]